MKKNILFISRDFSPKSNGTIACIENILPYLAKAYQVTMYVAREEWHSLRQECLFNCTIKRPDNVFDNMVLLRNHLQQYINKLSMHLRFKRIVSLVIKATFAVAVAVAKQRGYKADKLWSGKLHRYIEKKEDLNQYHAVLAVGAPFINITSACQVKKDYPHLKLILLQFDLFTDNPVWLLNDGNKEYARQLRLAQEKQWYALADYIIVTTEMYEVIKNSELSLWLDKIYPASMPVLCNVENNAPRRLFQSDDLESIHVVYTGSFYQDVRNPQFALEVFELLCRRDSRIKLHIIGSGCENVIEPFKKTMGDNLVIHGQQSKTYCSNARYSADVLLNISNNTTAQAPSKILEYIGVGKPIINFYKIDGDICQGYLKKYPFSLSVYEDLMQKQQLSEQIYAFIMNYKGKECDYTHMASIYSEFLPKTYADKIITLLDK